MKLTKIMLAVLMVLLGTIYVAFAFPVGVLDTDILWFIGIGSAIVCNGFLNLVAARDSARSLAGYLAFGSNLVFAILFIIARQVITMPLVYVGICLYLAATLLYGIGFVKPRRKWQEYSTPANKQDTGPDLLQGIEVVPMLRIFDRKKAEEFYVNWLGFKIEWEHRFDETSPVYMEITKPGIKIHLTEHHGDCTPGGKAFIVCSGLQEYHQQLLDKNYPYNRPGIEMASWGSLCMTAIDPFGNQLLFTEQKK